MAESGNRTFFILIVAGIVLAVLLVHFGLRIEGRLGSIETRALDRAPTAAPLQKIDASPENVATGQTVYVPVYSHIYHDGGRELALEATLSIRNTDPDDAIVIESIRYYDTAGSRIKDYIEKPVNLGPLASADFLVERRDSAGGVGANFLIEWVAESAVQEPLIEAVMVGHVGNRSVSFVRSGHPISDHPGNQ